MAVGVSRQSKELLDRHSQPDDVDHSGQWRETPQTSIVFHTEHKWKDETPESWSKRSWFVVWMLFRGEIKNKFLMLFEWKVDKNLKFKHWTKVHSFLGFPKNSTPQDSKLIIIKITFLSRETQSAPYRLLIPHYTMARGTSHTQTSRLLCTPNFLFFLPRFRAASFFSCVDVRWWKRKYKNGKT